MIRIDHHPSQARIALGLLLAPLAAASVIGLTQPLNGVGPIGASNYWRYFMAYTGFSYLGGVAIALTIGAPAYLLLEHRVKLRWWTCILAGAGVVTTPWLLLVALVSLTQPSLDGGAPTLLELCGLALPPASLGGVGGLAFWLIAFVRWRKPSPFS